MHADDVVLAESGRERERRELREALLDAVEKILK